jgi:two-component system sensor histidine kinase DesK
VDASRGTAPDDGRDAATEPGRLPASMQDISQIAPRLANGVVTTVVCGFVLLALIGLVARTDGMSPVVLAVSCMIPIVALQLGYFSRPGVRLLPPVSYIALAAQAALVYLPILQFRTLWLSFPGFLAGSALVALRPAVGAVLFVVIVASIGVFQYQLDESFVSHLYSISYAVVATTITGLVVFGLTRLARLVNEVHAARAELSRMAAAEERLRLARDVHDLLGLSLSALTLKCELTYRLMNDHPERARAELADMLAIARRALADVRMVAAGRRELSLPHEWGSAQSVLSTADIDVRIRRDQGEIKPPAATVLATVLREGVTNVLRHSKASWCEITLRTHENVVELDIVNDGVNEESGSDRGDALAGRGIGNLSHRVSHVGGTLRAGVEEGGRYRLTASIPMSPPAEEPG